MCSLFFGSKWKRRAISLDILDAQTSKSRWAPPPLRLLRNLGENHSGQLPAGCNHFTVKQLLGQTFDTSNWKGVFPNSSSWRGIYHPPELVRLGCRVSLRKLCQVDAMSFKLRLDYLSRALEFAERVAVPRFTERSATEGHRVFYMFLLFIERLLVVAACSWMFNICRLL